MILFPKIEKENTQKGSFFEITVFKNKTGKSVAGMQQYLNVSNQFNTLKQFLDFKI
jgi:hypothetical protein